MKTWQKIVVIISVVSVLVCSLCVSGFAYVSDYGNRYIKDSYYYSVPYNIGIRTIDSMWLSFANTPFYANDISTDYDYWYNFVASDGSTWSATVNTGFGQREVYSYADVYFELGTSMADSSSNYGDRIIGNYMSFKKFADAKPNAPFATWDVYHEYTVNGQKLELKYDCLVYGSDGQLYSVLRTEYLDPVSVTDYQGIKRTLFGVLLGDFDDYVSDPCGTNATCPVISYESISITALNVNHVRHADIEGYRAHNTNITIEMLANRTTKYEAINNDVLGWLATSIDSLCSAYIIPASGDFGGVTIGGMLGVALAVPLVVAFLKIFVGG